MVSGHYRLETKIIGRAAKDKNGKAIPDKQVSVVAKAAYRSGQSLKDDRAEKTFNYRSRSPEVAYSEIMAPENAPDWLQGECPASNAGTKKERDVREYLWNMIERKKLSITVPGRRRSPIPKSWPRRTPRTGSRANARRAMPGPKNSATCANNLDRKST